MRHTTRQTTVAILALLCGAGGLATHAGGTQASSSGPEASASLTRMTPDGVMARMGQTIDLVTRQKPAFGILHPKTANMTGRTYFFWGGKDTCRPGKSVDPTVYFAKQSLTASSVGDCAPGFPVRSVPLSYPPGFFIRNMNKVVGALKVRNGLQLEYGDTTHIKASRTMAAFTFRCEASGNTRRLQIDAVGDVVSTAQCE